MRRITDPTDAINPYVLTPGSVIYMSGNAATSQVLGETLAADLKIRDITLYCLLPLGQRIAGLYAAERCAGITHRVCFNSYLTREAVNNGRAYYHPVHLSELPRMIQDRVKPSAALISVSGPDRGGRYSLGTTVEGVLAAIETVVKNGGVVIAENNRQMPFVLGTTIPESDINYLIDVDYPLPVSPVQQPDQLARRMGEIIAALYVKDGTGTNPGSTLQYGIGEVPDAVTDAILRFGYGDLSVHTELFADGMTRLVQAGVVTNRWKTHLNFSVSAIFLASSQEGYNWLSYNSAVQSRPTNYTNSVFKIAEQPNMVSVNSAIGVDLHGNIWADSLEARRIYSGVGGQADFIRGAQYSPGGVAIIALKSVTSDGLPKVVDRSPAGITTTAIPSDPVILVTEHGAFDPRGLSLGERAWGIAHLAGPTERERLMKIVLDHPAYHKPNLGQRRKVPGFTSYDDAIKGRY